MKSNYDKLAVFILAALFRAARMAGGRLNSAEEAFDDAEEFVKEGSKRNIDLEKLK